MKIKIMMKTLGWIFMVAGVAGVGGVGGCNWQARQPINERQIPDRAAYGDKALPYEPPPPHVEMVNPDPTARGGGRVPAPVTEERITGTWTFVTPETVTRVEQQTGQFSRYSLYEGRPEPTDTPFLVITISKDARGMTPSDPATYKIGGQRDYALNGNLAHEWSGNTNTGSGFSELLIKKAGGEGGDVCSRVIAVAKNGNAAEIGRWIFWGALRGMRK